MPRCANDRRWRRSHQSRPSLRDPFPKLVVSGGHSPAFDAVCDFLTDHLRAARAVVAGRGHSAPRTGEPFNERLRAFIDAA